MEAVELQKEEEVILMMEINVLMVEVVEIWVVEVRSQVKGHGPLVLVSFLIFQTYF